MAPIALRRGLQVIEALARRPNGLSFSELAELLACSNTSTMRLLQGLEQLGYVGKNGDGRYRAGPAMAGLSRPAGLRERLQPVVHHFVVDLRERTDNTAMAIAWSGEHMVCLETQPHERSIPLQTAGNISASFRYCPWGWFFKGAGYWTEEREGDFDRRQDAVPALSLIRSELQRLERDGFCVHWRPDRRRLAAPLVSERDGMLGALVIGGSPQSLPDERILACGHVLAAEARSCSAMLG